MKKILAYSFLIVFAAIGFAQFADAQSPSCNVRNLSSGVEKNVSGYAWSSNIGWVSMSCENSNTCGSSDYGVAVLPSGEVEGYAWSSNVGWISFFSEDTTNCPSGTCGAQFNSDTGELSGWARALSPTCGTSANQAGNWDGWIYLGQTSRVDVSAQGCAWSGYAWGGGENNLNGVIGWLSFNGPGYGVNGSGDACQVDPGGPPVISFSASPTSVSVGSASTLTWSATNADQCVGDGQDGFTTSNAVSGTQSVSPDSTTTYTVRCTGSGGERTASVTVSVTDVDLIAGLPTITRPNNSQIRFVAPVTNTGSTAIAQGIDIYFQVDLDSDSNDFDENLSAIDAVINLGAGQTKNGAFTWNSAPAGTHEVRACADLPANEISETNEANNCGPIRSFTISGGGLPVISFTADPSTINPNGSSTLTWSATNADRCVGDGQDGFVTGDAVSGSQSVSPASSTTYRITCHNSNGLSSSNASVTIDSGGGGGGGGGAPTASLSASPDEILLGGNATLTWSAQRANSCTGTGFSTGGSTSGSVQVSPTNDASYQLRCVRGAQDIVVFEDVDVLFPDITITADGIEGQTRVQNNAVIEIAWQAEDVNSCNITGPGLNLQNQTGDPITGNQNTTISQRSTYTIECFVQGTPFTESVVVNIPPDFEEF